MRMVFVLTSIMWLSRVEIVDYFALYLDHCIVAFESLYCRTCVEGGGSRMCYVGSSDILTHMSVHVCQQMLLGARVRV